MSCVGRAAEHELATPVSSVAATYSAWQKAVVELARGNVTPGVLVLG